MNTSQTDPMVGHLLDGRYQVRARIARGGMATVYLATDLRLERRVAIKVMHGHLADDAAFRDRFIQEARSAARLAHPNVVNVFDQGQDSDMAYLVMEYLQGITLRDLLKEYGKLTPEQTMDIMEAVLAGLAAAHKAGIVHRDLKPENVLLADDGRIKISDFGLARAATANTATGQALLGTIAYLSPELVTRGIADTRSDIYAVGIMMYEMLVGEQPYKGDQPVQIAYQHANERVPSPSAKNPSVPAALDELVLWATARDPEQRPRDARTLLDQLFDTQNLIREGAGTTPAPTQRTMVMPSAAAPGGTSAVTFDSGETQVLARARRTGPVVLENAAKLAGETKGRSRRGFWLFGLVILLAALAGGTGWYFGAGPGASTTIPTGITGLTPEAATALLVDQGFVVSDEPTRVFDWQVAKDLVSTTDPEPGAAAAKGSTITLVVSDGPESLPVPAVSGQAEGDARTALTDARFVVADDSVKEFNGDVPAGSVIRVQGADGAVLGDGATYPDHGTVTLVVSVGGVPDVYNLSYDDAASLLTGSGLQIARVGDEFDNSGAVPAGNVMSVTYPTNDDGSARTIVPNDTIGVVVSKGIEQVTVPNVVGLTWDVARGQLEAAGVIPSYSSLADSSPSSYLVSGVSPGAGAVVNRGSTVTVTFTL
ncbi:Stk1 family PASTA domain-containing Ser/Thr kinase [Amnibacterium flavum]|uniref:non-specific serine/threonine protein kinase n=1 Tax=Amnibacterium flavum TaxID=2173173 RepID=A0A2V1HSP5_9MICO|nr:Stk1 family PASTA domain-containing Ser/Thr kinase [Amnibacterium flavum]PVZ94692.1 Stk1 family PASTA domain-containing Ser/Thr kinase [Amnibacterium flavum]